MKKHKIIAAGAATALGGAFVITMSGGQFFATKNFFEFTKLNYHHIDEVLVWLSAITCGYVMLFTRGLKIYQGLNKIASKKGAHKKQLSIPGKLIGGVGGFAGIIRSILLGYIGTYSLIEGFGVNSLLVIGGVAAYVCVSNTVSYLKFTLAKAVDNGEFIVKFFSRENANNSQQPKVVNKHTSKKILTVMVTLPALVGAFAYFEYLSYAAIQVIPYAKYYLSNYAAHGIAATVSGLTVITGGLAKGVQYYKYLTEQEHSEIPADQLAASNSALSRSHQGFGGVYTLFYSAATFIGLIVLSQVLGIDERIAIPLAILIAVLSTILEYAFSVRIMVTIQLSANRDCRRMIYLQNT